MSGPSALAIELSQRQQAMLQQILRRHTSSQRLVRRVQIILKANRGENNEQIGRELQLNRNSVAKWRRRWHEATSKLGVLEAKGIEDKRLMAWIEGILADQERPGTPASFTTQQVVQIVALACEDPEASGVPTSNWTAKQLAGEAMQRGIVERISPRSVERFLKRSYLTAASKPLLA
jgi:putative transposase